MVTDDRGALWRGPDAYELYMGRWSRAVAPLFLTWLSVPQGAEWIDVGCGTGVLSTAVLAGCEPTRVVGIDSSEMFTAVARDRIRDQRFTCTLGDAAALPADDGEFGACVSGLVLNFVPDKTRCVAEMTRVVRPGGLVGLYVWDYAGHMQIMRYFFAAATELDVEARRFDDGINAPICRPRPLQRQFLDAGLGQVSVTAIDIPAAFASFEEYWTPFLGGTGSAPRYCSSLSPAALDELRGRLEQRLPTGPDGEILLAVRAWAVKGVVAG